MVRTLDPGKPAPQHAGQHDPGSRMGTARARAEYPGEWPTPVTSSGTVTQAGSWCLRRPWEQPAGPADVEAAGRLTIVVPSPAGGGA